MIKVDMKVNGTPISATIEPRTSLADFLREHLNLTGTHLGCEHGVCGACTIIVDGQPVRSCISYAVLFDHAEVQTIEGLDDDEIASQLRVAFQREHALQCGYCTPGMMVSACDIVRRMPNATEEEIRIAMSGNLCRCTGYVGIVKAIQSVIALRQGTPPVAHKVRPLGPVGAQISKHGKASGSETPVQGKSNPDRRPAFAIDENFIPQNTLHRAFVVDFPVDQVWNFFGQVEQVASCLPGARVDQVSSSGLVEGHISVKVGPISAGFEGVAQITRHAQEKTGVIVGMGRDQKSNSSTKGRVLYQLSPAQDGIATQVDIEISYTLTGMLAQFSRSGLVDDVANRMLGAFVGNIENRLSGRALGQDAQKEFDAGGLIWAVLKGRMKALLAWMGAKP